LVTFHGDNNGDKNDIVVHMQPRCLFKMLL
jgi:hypothetical protein